jgi:putative molybdopterin biosynthesis protein
MLVELRLGGLMKLNGHDVPVGQTIALLDAVADDRSVRAAAERLGVSYRSAWGRVLILEKAFGQPLVRKTKGHGSVLTDFGEAVRQALGAPFRELATPLAAQERRLQTRLASLSMAKPERLRIAASHDPLLIETVKDRSAIDLVITGTEQAIDRLRSGASDAAGCHFGPEEADGERALPARLRHPGTLVHSVFRREQGLIVTGGNPLGIRSVEDIARTGARFVNRQRGSGTRGWFDRLLAGADLAASRIVGYEVEEFTHQAIGAMIASGAADVGLGVRAVADAFRLSFLPLGTETYYLATRADLRSSLLEQLIDDLAARARGTSGYAAASRRKSGKTGRGRQSVSAPGLTR